MSSERDIEQDVVLPRLMYYGDRCQFLHGSQNAV